MESYIIPTLEQNPETIIIHSGTDDLKSDSSPEEIARDVKLTTSCKTQTNNVILSSIVPRYDNLNEKATRVNKCQKPEIFVLLITEIFLQSKTVTEVGCIEIIVEPRN